LSLALNELSSAKDIAEKADHDKSKFIAFLCHELRNPLHALVASCEFLKSDTCLNSEQESQLNSLSSSMCLMTNIVNDVLDLTKIENGTIDLDIKPLNIREVVNHSCVIQKQRCKENKIALKIEIDDNVPEMLNGDQTRISQILYNLISNAIKFTHKGHIRVHISCDELKDLDSIVLHISVSDTGIGIHPDAISKLFNRFTQENSSVVREYGGTGLGLFICKQLALRMDGDIRVESVLGKGSTFFVNFEMKVIQCVCDNSLLKKDQIDGANSSVIPQFEVESELSVEEVEKQLQGLRILYADDQLINRKLMQKYLEKCGIELVLVKDGLEAVVSSQNASPKYDIVLLDINVSYTSFLSEIYIFRCL
jgi:K+-sensing histidine kinase KdpD